MTECGLYQVVGPRDYRGHVTGSVFPARLDPKQERRSIMRGAIARIGSANPRPDTYEFPSGWLALEMPDNQQREEA